MAENVTGDTYRAITRQLREILRQLDQDNGYPYSLETLKQGLQVIIEGKFGKLGHALYSFFVTLFGGSNSHRFSVGWRRVVKFGEPILRDLIVPVQLDDGTYCLMRFENHQRGTIVDFPDLYFDFMSDAQEMPVVEWVGSSLGPKGIDNVWRIVVIGKTHKKSSEFYCKNNELIFLRFRQSPISHGGGHAL